MNKQPESLLLAGGSPPCPAHSQPVTTRVLECSEGERGWTRGHARQGTRAPVKARSEGMVRVCSPAQLQCGHACGHACGTEGSTTLVCMWTRMV
eukprot:scaffold8740_cov20-Tisochrysis_lutea.AAC.2